jgi:protein TonB
MKQLTIQFKLLVLRSVYLFVNVLAEATNANSYIVRKKIQIGAAIISLTIVLNSCSTANKNNEKDTKKNVAETITKCYISSPEVVNLPKDRKDTLSQKIQPKIPKLKPNPRDSAIEIVSCYDGVDPVEVLPIEETNDDTLIIAEQMPNFKGGLDSMQKFIYKNLHYPNEMVGLDMISGYVYLQFVVTIKGDIEHIKVLRSLHPTFDIEAIRVVKLMPRWIPGKQGGIERNIRFTLPIRFSFE